MTTHSYRLKMDDYRFGPSLDCADAQTLAAFWAEYLGGEITLAGEGVAVVTVPQGWLTAYKVDSYQPPTGQMGPAPGRSTSTLRYPISRRLRLAHSRWVPPSQQSSLHPQSGASSSIQQDTHSV